MPTENAENLETPETVTDATDPAPTPEPKNDNASPPPKKSWADTDKLLEEAAKTSAQAQARMREADILKNKYQRYAEAEALLEKGDIKGYTKALLGEKYVPASLIEEFSEDVELPPEHLDPADLAKQIPDLIDRGFEARDKARKAQEEEDARKAREAADKAKQDEIQAVREEYVAETAADLKAHAAEFPLASAWAHRITPEKVVDTIHAFAKEHQRVPDPKETLAIIEAEFQAEIDRTPFGRKPSKPTAQDDLDREFEEIDRQARAKLQHRDPSLPPPAPTKPTSWEEEIFAEAEKMDRDRASRLRY